MALHRQEGSSLGDFPGHPDNDASIPALNKDQERWLELTDHEFEGQLTELAETWTTKQPKLRYFIYALKRALAERQNSIDGMSFEVALQYAVDELELTPEETAKARKKSNEMRRMAYELNVGLHPPRIARHILEKTTGPESASNLSSSTEEVSSPEA